MKKILIALMVLGCPVAAQAGQQSTVCQVLKQHKPMDNVAYQPGVDVKGKAVVPADLNAASMPIPSVVKVPVEIDLAKRIASLNGKNVQLDAPMGMVEIHSDGRVMYGEQDWTSSVKTLCGMSHAVEAPQLAEVTVETPTKAAEIAPAAPAGQEATAMPQKITPAEPMKVEAKVNVEQAPAKIISNRPDIMEKIEGGAYREYGE